jgi:hypothetical protein
VTRDRRRAGAGRSVNVDTAAGTRPTDVNPVFRAEDPVVVLTYPYAGAELLQAALAVNPSLACTSGTGTLPLCYSALSVWREVEGRNAAPSVLAIKSIRAFLGAMTTIVRARSGASRWCEFAFASPEAAEAFLVIFPEAKFICLHRAFPSVATEGLRAFPWGLGDSPFWGFAGQHPGNNVATIAAYWAAFTEPLLDFQERHSERTARVRYEDLVADTGSVADAVFHFVGMNTERQFTGAARHEPPGAMSPVPTELLAQLPGSLQTRITDLNARLDYPVVGDADTAVPGN